jgi:hypothetical protein
MLNQAFAEFRQHVLLNPPLQALLRQESDESLFVARVVAAGKMAGFNFSEADVREAMRANRQSWLERWL